MVYNNLPKYEYITKDILKKIQDGSYPLNSKIPREVDLAKKYDVSRPTVRHAIENLVNSGYLDRRKKRGTVVKQIKVAQEFTHTIENYEGELRTNNLTLRNSILNLEIEKANDEVKKNLKLQDHESVFKLIRIRYIEHQPIVLETNYIPKKLVPNLNEYNFERISLYNVLEMHHLKINHVNRKIEAIKADETTASLLNLNTCDPVFYIHVHGFTQEELPVEYSISKYRADLNSFSIDLRH